MTMFTEGRLQVYERMMRDKSRSYRPKRSESHHRKIDDAENNPKKQNSGKNGERNGSISR